MRMGEEETNDLACKVYLLLVVEIHFGASTDLVS